MTTPCRTAVEGYRDSTRCNASAEFAPAVLDRLGLADRYRLIESAIGPVYVAWNPRGISALRRADDAEAFERWFRKRFARRALPANDEPQIVEQARRALAGEKVEIAADLRDCTPFEAAVLRKAGEIPRGHARPYAWVAREIGRPRAVRAVGSALANNPVPLLIPCHRVVRSDYTIGDYVFGDDLKHDLLVNEGLAIDGLGAIGRRGIRFIGERGSGEFCLPSCGNLWANTPEADRLSFQTCDEAQACGLRPCSTCRPMAA